MRKKIVLVVIFGFFLAMGTVFVSLSAQEVASQEDPGKTDSDASLSDESGDVIPGGMDGYISLDLRGIDVIDALKFLSVKADLDIVATKAVTGRVTLMVENVLVKDIFDIMLRSNHLAYDKEGEIYNVMTQQEYASLYGRPFADTRVVKTLRLQYAVPSQAFSLLETIKSDIGRVLVEPESGNVLMIDIPEKISQMEEALAAFEQKNEIRIFPLQYANAKEIEEQLKTQLDSKQVGLIKADERGNQVMVQTLPDRMEEIARLIKELDTKTREVLVRTSIVQVRFADETTKGVSWEGLFDSGRDRSLVYFGSTPFASVQSATGDFRTRSQTFQDIGEVGSYPFSGTTSNFSSSVPKIGLEELHVGVVGAQDVDYVIKYIETLGTTKVLANPKLVVTNNQESRIHVGERQAYVTTTTTTGQVTSTVAEDVTFVDTGIQLSITPAINSDGYVTMKVKAEISSVASTLITPTQNKIPIINTSLAETTVMVKGGTTIILGGLKREEKTTDTKKTPILSKIPFLGELFKSVTEGVERTELLVMLTPILITGDVLVSGSGQQVETVPIKGRQEYDAVEHVDQTIGISKVESPPLPDEKVLFKGLRIGQ